MGRGDGCASWRFKKAAKKFFVQTCGGSFCPRQQSHGFRDSPSSISPAENLGKNISCRKISLEHELGNSTTSPSFNKNLCPICLDPVNHRSASSPGQAVFTAQCSHAFHFSCISSNVRHGSLTCPICRAHWTHLPRNLNTRSNKADPVLRIIDDSIANFRVHRRSFLRSARYDDDDPVEPDPTTGQHRLHLSLCTAPLAHPNLGSCSCSCSCSCSSSMAESPLAHHFPSAGETPGMCSPTGSYLRVRLAHQPASDLVLVVASPNGQHLRLVKQYMSLIVSSLRPVDRLAIVTYSSSASRAFPLRRMTSYGRRTALQVIDRLFYSGQADPTQGLKKGVKILVDRVHKNPQSFILHLADTPSSSSSYQQIDVEIPVRVFHVGFEFGASNEFEEFLARTLGGVIGEVELRIGERSRIVGIGEMRGGEERNVPLYLDERGRVRVEYRYVDGGEGECAVTGEMVVCGGEGGEDDGGFPANGRMSGGGNWDYHDPFMARRWAKHLHSSRQ